MELTIPGAIDDVVISGLAARPGCCDGCCRCCCCCAGGCCCTAGPVCTQRSGWPRGLQLDSHGSGTMEEGRDFTTIPAVSTQHQAVLV